MSQDGIIHVYPIALLSNIDAHSDGRDLVVTPGQGMAGYRARGVVLHTGAFTAMAKNANHKWVEDLFSRLRPGGFTALSVESEGDEWTRLVLKALKAPPERQAMFKMFWGGE